MPPGRNSSRSGPSVIETEHFSSVWHGLARVAWNDGYGYVDKTGPPCTAGANLQPSGSFFEVPFGKRAARAGLQVALEAQCARFVWEDDHDMKPPRSMASRVRASPGVVVREAGVHVSGDAYAEMLRSACAG